MRKGDIGFVLVLFLSLSFVFALHTVTTSTGTSSYSVDEDVVSVFNITVNNTDTLNTSNITQVNITFDSSFTFVTGTNGTDAGTHTFTNSSTVVSWSNDGLVMNLTNQSFWFNATPETPGSYNLTVTSVNTTGSYVTNISVTVNDTGLPTWVSGANWSSYNNQSVAILLNATDSVGIANYSVNDTTNFQVNASNYLVNITTLNSSVYWLNVIVNDTSGNNVSRIITVTMTVVPAAAAAAATDSGSTGGIVNRDFSLGIPLIRMKPRARYSFNVGDEGHYLYWMNLNTTSQEATFDIYSEKQIITVKLGEKKNVDLDLDGDFDITLNFEKIYDDKFEIDLIVKEFASVVDSAADGDEVADGDGGIVERGLEKVDDVLIKGNYWWILVILVLAIGLLIWWYKNSNNKKVLK